MLLLLLVCLIRTLLISNLGCDVSARLTLKGYLSNSLSSNSAGGLQVYGSFLESACKKRYLEGNWALPPSITSQLA